MYWVKDVGWRTLSILRQVSMAIDDVVCEYPETSTNERLMIALMLILREEEDAEKESHAHIAYKCVSRFLQSLIDIDLATEYGLKRNEEFDKSLPTSTKQ